LNAAIASADVTMRAMMGAPPISRASSLSGYPVPPGRNDEVGLVPSWRMWTIGARRYAFRRSQTANAIITANASVNQVMAY
jgi:hypothetical protein